ncbi:MAG: polysaccharide deacetylase family protein [Chloroflexia bacterium]|nr:polysaccharide deacetylase family protein [Chloroflexia bacterium]
MTGMDENQCCRRLLLPVVLMLLALLVGACADGPSGLATTGGGPTSAPPTATASPVPPSPTSPPTATPDPSPTPTPPPPTATTEPTVDPTIFLQQVQANELGWILVLEYHLIEEPGGRWSRTPDNFRRDVEQLIAAGYYPINLIDLARGQIDVPAGKTPIVLTFDDSSSGQCRYLEDGQPDPDSACGILLAAAQAHPQDWQPRATFFVLLDVDLDDRILFGQPEWAEKKLQDLVGWGMEIGSHTISHYRLDQGTEEKIRWQLAVSENTIEAIVPGYELQSLSAPLGMYPEDESLIHGGVWEEQVYDFEAVVEVAGGPSASPFSLNFDPYHIRRNQVFEDELDIWLDYFEIHPELRYISDGDPLTVSIPHPLPERLQGLLAESLPEGMALRQYPLGQ